MKVFVVVGVAASLLVAGAADARSRHRSAPGGSRAAAASRMPNLAALDGGAGRGGRGAGSLDDSTLTTGGGKGGGLGSAGLSIGGGKHGGGGDLSGLGGGKHHGGGDDLSGLGGGRGHHGGGHKKSGGL
jgi:hypothetical protein